MCPVSHIPISSVLCLKPLHQPTALMSVTSTCQEAHKLHLISREMTLSADARAASGTAHPSTSLGSRGSGLKFPRQGLGPNDN